MGRQTESTSAPGAEANGLPLVAMIKDDDRCIRCGLCVDWCPTECLTMDHFRLTPAEERESVDLAVVAD